MEMTLEPNQFLDDIELPHYLSFLTSLHTIYTTFNVDLISLESFIKAMKKIPQNELGLFF